MVRIKKEYLTIFIIQVTEVLGFSLILPFLPFYAQTFGASAFVIGLIGTVFSFFQFFSAPIMGELSDRYGRKPLLLISQFSTLLSFIILGLANSLVMIFISRIVDGLLGSNYTIAQAYLSDISSKKERSKAFSVSGVAFGFGFLVGPALGGFLSRFGYSVPAYVAAGVSLVSMIMTIFFLQETINNQNRDKTIEIKLIQWQKFKEFWADRQIARRFWQIALFFLALIVWRSTFSLYAQNRLNIGPEIIGYLLAYAGLASIIFRGLLLPRLLDNTREEKLRLIGIAAAVLGMILAALINRWWLFPLIITFFSFGNGILRPLLIGEVSRLVEEGKQGAILGMVNSLSSLAQIIGPFIGGTLVNFMPSFAVPAFSALLLGIILAFFLQEFRQNQTQQR